MISGVLRIQAVLKQDFFWLKLALNDEKVK